MGLIEKVYYGPDGIARRMFDHYTHFPLLAELAPRLRWWVAIPPNAWLDGKLTVSLLLRHTTFLPLIASLIT